MKPIRGRVWKFGDHINTDNMSPAPYMFSMEEVAKHCLEAVRPAFAKEAREGDVVLGGDNFGTGSSRETAPRALNRLGISMVIAKSFARIFFRNAIDIGLPAVISPQAYEVINDGDIVSADLRTGELRDETTGEVLGIEPMPQTMRAILEAGGLINYALGQKW